MTENDELFQIKENLDKELKSLLELPEVDKIQKNADIKSMIPYYLKLSDNIDKRRISTYDFTTQYLIVLATALGVYIAYIKPEHNLFFYCIISIFFIQFLFSLFLIFVYLKQTKFKYPFKGLNQWKWFYYGINGIQNASTKVVIADKKINNTQLPYYEGLVEFISNYREENLDKELSSNIQQLYLLLAHNYYKNKFDSQLTGIRIDSFYASLIFILGYIIVYYAIYWFCKINYFI